MKTILTHIFVFLSILSFSQDEELVTSLRQKIAKTSNDHLKLELLIELGSHYVDFEIDSLYGTAHQVINLARKLDQPCDEAKGYHYKGGYFYIKGEYNEALAFYQKSLTLRERNCDIKTVAESAIQIANVYNYMGDYDQAYLFYYQSLGIYEDLGDTENMSAAHSSLGLVDIERDQYKNALDNFDKSLKYHEGSSDSIQLGNIYNNYGNLFQVQELYDTAVVYFQMAMDIYSEINYSNGLAHGYNNIGIIYYYQGLEDSCLNYFKKSLEIRKQTGEKSSISQSYNNIGILYGYQKNFELAVTYSDSALHLAQNAGLKEEISDAYLNLYEVYLAAQDFEKAVINLKQFTDYKDSLVSAQSEQLMHDAQIKYETIKKENEIHENQALIFQNTTKLKRQNLIIWASLIGGVLLALLCLVILNRNKVTKRQNKIIEEQKFILEQKQTEIIDSIHYAKKIQDALLKSDSHVSSHLPENSVLFIPKDIVSGDFYWVHEKDNFLYLAVADCTGHGVPGGFLTMLGSSFLNEIISSSGLAKPGKILDELRNRIVSELSQTGDIGENRDGMDISMLRLNLKTNEISWAGANNPFWLIPKSVSDFLERNPGYSENEGFIEIKANKEPIGHYWKMTPFTNHEMKLSKGDTFFLFSDGYADQFGGDKGRKFKQKNLKSLLLKSKSMELEAIKQKLHSEYIEWKGETEQIDDICIMSVRI